MSLVLLYGASAAGLLLVWIVGLYDDQERSHEIDYKYGPRGGRYTIERSYDGGEYKRYR